MRTLGTASSLSPCPVTRYETVRENAATELTESVQEQAGVNASSGYDDRLFQDPSSLTSLPETNGPRIEGVIERGRQTGASLPSEPERELIRQRRQNDPGIYGEKNGEGDVAKEAPVGTARPSVDSTQVSGRSNSVRPKRQEISPEGASELVFSDPRPNGGVSDRREARADSLTQRPESLPGMGDSVSQPVSVRPQDVVSDSFRPTLNEVSFQRVRGEGAAPPIGARPPVVQIRIGRIEVRAVEPPVPAPSKKFVEPPRSSLSLDQYLRRRSPES